VNKPIQKAFSLIELLTVISIIAILAALLLSALVSAKARSRHAACLNNLRQIGLGFTAFALDHDGKYPMDVPERLGGSIEYNDSRLITNTPFSRDFHHFLALSNEVPNVKVMVCPADRKRRAAENYQTFTNDNLSYWANTRAVPHATLATLAGDWNAYNASATSNDWEQINFGPELHAGKGSVLFADGRVEITRSLAIQASPPDNTIAVASPPTPTPNPAGAARNARPQPNAQRTPAPAPAIPPSSVIAPPTRNSPDEKKPNPINPPATNTTAQAISSTSLEKNSGGYRRKSIPSSSVESKPEQLAAPAPPNVNIPANGPAGNDDPWDTPGFRLFKMLAFASYLISLLWAIIALLILYLRARMAQREQEQAAAIDMDS
jgi:prepilin-type N-terminal cleavage/methylation domain-containing protein/prepilin-type processing-associated H-X9-DG protein